MEAAALHRKAHQSYLAGDFKNAVKRQVAVVNDFAKKGEPSIYHTKILTLYLFSMGDLRSACRLLQDLKKKASDDPEVLENLGVVQRKLGMHQEAIENLLAADDLAPGKANVHDALAHSFGNTGDLEKSRFHGEKSLKIKDDEAGKNGKPFPIPERLPPVFDFTEPEKNIIAFSLFGQDPRYLSGALRNATLAPEIYPGWQCRFYVDKTVPQEVVQRLEKLGAQIEMMDPPKQFFEGLFWRFRVMSDPKVKRFLIRDADSVINIKERVAVDEWLVSDKHFHVMRDFYSHTEVILAGMWGGVTGILPNLNQLLSRMKTTAGPTSTYDQVFLRQMVWPTVRQSVLIHDSVFNALGSQPFPEVGALPPDRHIGQNAAVLKNVKAKEA